MRFTVITLFPDLLEAFSETGIVGRCRKRGLVSISALDLREFSNSPRRDVDNAPFGGGPGMVLGAPPLKAAIATARELCDSTAHVIYLTPQGRRFDQRSLVELTSFQHLVFVAGRYEGVDERIVANYVDSEWSLGDFVTSGGELPAMVMIDALVRQLPGALGHARSALEDSFSDGLLDYPHYTRPRVFEGKAVPEVLLSGDHEAIRRWRRAQQLLRTAERRPDLFLDVDLRDEDRELIRRYAVNVAEKREEE